MQVYALGLLLIWIATLTLGALTQIPGLIVCALGLGGTGLLVTAVSDARQREAQARRGPAPAPVRTLTRLPVEATSPATGEVWLSRRAQDGHLKILEVYSDGTAGCLPVARIAGGWKPNSLLPLTVPLSRLDQRA